MWSPVPVHTDTILHGYGYSKEYTESPVSVHSDPDVYYRLLNENFYFCCRIYILRYKDFFLIKKR